MLNKVAMRPEVEQRFSELKTAMLLNVPFFASIWLDALTLKVGKFPELLGDKGTAGTNGRAIFFDEDFLMKLTLTEDVFLFCHEIGHCMFLHMARAKQYESIGLHGKPFNPYLWNVAGDYIINAMLIECRIGSMPVGGLIDQRFTGSMLIEDVYKTLLDEMPQQPKRPPTGDGDGDEPTDGTGGTGGVYGDTIDVHITPSTPTGDEVDLTEQEWRRVVQSAVDGAKAVGKLPGMLERLANEFVNPQVRWQDKLRKMVVTHTVRDSTNWAQPHRRRLVTQKIYMPRRSGFTAGTIVVANDTSGSISDQEMNVYVSELASILETCNPEIVYVLSCDAQIHSVDEFPQGHDIKSNPPTLKGGGGTSFRPVFDWIEEAALSPSALIYFTDLYGSFPDSEPSYPVIWCATSEENVPFGDVVRIKVDRA